MTGNYDLFLSLEFCTLLRDNHTFMAIIKKRINTNGVLKKDKIGFKKEKYYIAIINRNLDRHRLTFEMALLADSLNLRKVYTYMIVHTT